MRLTLPTTKLGGIWDIFHVASCLAQSMPCNPAETSRAHPATAPTLQRAESVCRSHPQTPHSIAFRGNALSPA
jgi:hypothetical protein